MSCRAGEFVAYEYPFIVSLMRTSGLLNRLDSYADRGSNSYVKITIKALTGRNRTCHQEMVSCPPWIIVEETLGIPRPQAKVEKVVITENSSNNKFVANDQPVLTTPETLTQLTTTTMAPKLIASSTTATYNTTEMQTNQPLMEDGQSPSDPGVSTTPSSSSIRDFMSFLWMG